MLPALAARLKEHLRRSLSKSSISEYFRAGYKFKKAKKVLTSNDPEYHTKVEVITQILSDLKEDEAFFSIDEHGPFAIKRKGGSKRVGPGEDYVVPQYQKSKGWLIITAALELSRNQITHFYSLKKNTEEMIKMADRLRAERNIYRTIYLSWDAASWHVLFFRPSSCAAASLCLLPYLFLTI